MNKKWIVGLSAALVTVSTVGVTAFADTANGTNSTPSNSTPSNAKAATASNGNAYRQYKGQIQEEIQQLRSLNAERKEDNTQIKALWETIKGKHVWKDNQSTLQAVKATHQHILAARTAYLADVATNKADRLAKNWGQLAVDLGKTNIDLQTLVTLKNQQVKNLQSVDVSAESAQSPSTNNVGSGA